MKYYKHVYFLDEEACKTVLQDELMTSKASVKQLEAVRDQPMEAGASGFLSPGHPRRRHPSADTHQLLWQKHVAQAGAQGGDSEEQFHSDQRNASCCR